MPFSWAIFRAKGDAEIWSSSPLLWSNDVDWVFWLDNSSFLFDSLSLCADSSEGGDVFSSADSFFTVDALLSSL